jgi:hypothetical protein
MSLCVGDRFVCRSERNSRGYSFHSACFVIPDGCIVLIQFCVDVLVFVYLFCLFCIAKLYILLTVHFAMILGKWPTWHTLIFYAFISILYISRATSCSSSGESNVSIQHPVYVTLCRWPFRALSDLHMTRSPTQSDIYRCCIDTIDSPDDEHEVARNM